MNENRKICLLIDGDNISARYIVPIIDEMNRHGDLMIKRIYGDWTTSEMKQWKDILSRYAIRPIQQFRTGPNATDNALIMDALEVTYTNRNIDTFAIASSDSDFYGLFMRLREHGYYVMGMGSKDSNELLTKSANDFIYLENLLPKEEPKQAQRKRTEKAKEGDELRDIIEDTCRKIDAEENEWIHLSYFGEILKKNHPDFDPRSYGHKQLLTIIRSYPDLLEISTGELDKTYLVRIQRGVAGDEDSRTGTVIRFGPYYGFIRSDEGDYYFHVTNLKDPESSKHVRAGTKVAFKVFRKPDPTSTSGEEKNGKASEVELLR
ncbi:MAG: NYN domain-containing protein [Candidatus Thermoplasmatota archaeon]|nr:NYN domain-containing protein [Candidatus Thermoplasmatota archaeon]